MVAMVATIVGSVVLIERQPPAIVFQQQRWEAVATRTIQDVRIGNDQMSQIGQLAVGSDLSIYVADPVAMGVFVIDSAGRTVRFLGGAGPGPGEFRRLGRIGFRSDTLWAHESTSHRLELFEPEGSRIGGRGVPPSMSTHGRLTFVALLSTGGMVDIPVFQPGQSPPEHPLIYVDSDRVPRHTLGHYLMRDAVLEFHRDNGTRLFMFNPLARKGAWAVASDGSSLAIANLSESLDSLQLILLGAAGQRMFARSIPVPRGFAKTTSVDDSVRNLLIARGVGAGEARRLVRSALAGSRKSVPFALLVSSDSAVWVGWQGHRDTRWEVYDSSGRYGGHFLLPLPWQARDIRNSTLWATSVDELDLPLLRRYALEGR